MESQELWKNMKKTIISAESEIKQLRLPAEFLVVSNEPLSHEQIPLFR